jgi:hypothetical protein
LAATGTTARNAVGSGLLPDFSPAVIAETNQITQAATASGVAIRDLRGLLWASIDNDDCRTSSGRILTSRAN